MYNFCSSSPQRWEILKAHMPVSLHSMSRTRGSARTYSVKPAVQHLHAIKNALQEMESLNLTTDARNQLQSTQNYIPKFECVLLSTLWLKLLTMIHETNLVIEVRDATLDVARDNIHCLMKNIQLIREQWDIILQEAKVVAQNEGI